MSKIKDLKNACSYIRLKQAMISGLMLFSFLQLHAQIKSVSYDLTYNKDSKQYDCYLIINEGNAKTVVQRTQFNAQISVVAPTGTKVEITQSYLPLRQNQNYDSQIPTNWLITSTVKHPSEDSSKDYYGLTPLIVPTAQYNDVNPGDKLMLFSISVDPIPEDINSVYLYRNLIDLGPTSAGMKGCNFANGFTMGGVKDLYKGNIGCPINGGQ